MMSFTGEKVLVLRNKKFLGYAPRGKLWVGENNIIARSRHTCFSKNDTLTYLKINDVVDYDKIPLDDWGANILWVQLTGDKNIRLFESCDGCDERLKEGYGYRCGHCEFNLHYCCVTCMYECTRCGEPVGSCCYNSFEEQCIQCGAEIRMDKEDADNKMLSEIKQLKI